LQNLHRKREYPRQLEVDCFPKSFLQQTNKHLYEENKNDNDHIVLIVLLNYNKREDKG